MKLMFLTGAILMILGIWFLINLLPGWFFNPHDWASSHDTKDYKTVFISLTLADGAKTDFDVCLKHGELRVIQNKLGR